MNTQIRIAMAVLLLGGTIPVSAGCIKGAVVGGVAGHLYHHHAILGAVAGCAVGHHMAVVKKREDEQKRIQAQQAVQGAH